MAIILAAQRAYSDGALGICGPTGEVRRVLEITGFDDVLTDDRQQPARDDRRARPEPGQPVHRLVGPDGGMKRMRAAMLRALDRLTFSQWSVATRP